MSTPDDAPRRRRGRPPARGTTVKQRRDHAVNQAVLAALAVSVRADVGGLGRPIAAPGGKDNLRKAFRDVARLFAELGVSISEGTIRAVWYASAAKRERRPRETVTESPDRGVPLSYRIAARILSVQAAPVSPFDVLAWRVRAYEGRPGPLHPFDLVREYQRDKRPIKSPDPC